MIDALGRPQSVLLLGGTSEIALAVLDALPQERLRRVVLAARDVEAAEQVAAQVRDRLAERRPAGAGSVEVVRCDAEGTDEHGRIIDGAFDVGDLDVVVLAVGVLGDQRGGEDDPRQAVAMARVTYLGALSLLLHAARRLRTQGHGVLVVLSSVAARQARPANFLYGSAKAGLDLAALGVLDGLEGSGARLLLVRPGFVRTRMTAGRRPPPLAVDPPAVARRVVRELTGPSRVLHVPRALGPVGSLLSVLPRRIVRRLPL